MPSLVELTVDPDGSVLACCRRCDLRLYREPGDGLAADLSRLLSVHGDAPQHREHAPAGWSPWSGALSQ